MWKTRLEPLGHTFGQANNSAASHVAPVLCMHPEGFQHRTTDVGETESVEVLEVVGGSTVGERVTDSYCGQLEFLQTSKKSKNLAVEDFRDAFGVTHEAAGLRFMNLATEHLGLPLHFLRVGDDGVVYKAYENDGLALPEDVTGSTEGQIVCRHWSAREAFVRTNRTTEYYQYTDTPEGTFWESTQIGTSTTDEFSITVGVKFEDAKWFRGRDTAERKISKCPDTECCRRPVPALREKWSGKAWTSARLHAHVLSPLRGGMFPGVDDVELFEFLEVHESPDTGVDA